MSELPPGASAGVAPRKRSRRWLRRLALTVGSIAALLGLLYFTTDWWVPVARRYFRARVAVAYERFGKHLPPVDEVEILALAGEVPEGTPDSFPPDLGPTLGTVNRRTLHGAEAEQFAALWRAMEFGEEFRGICHAPYYAFRFRRGGKLVLGTSVCWHCGSFNMPVGFIPAVPAGFNRRDGAAHRLLDAATQYAPHPEPTETP
jgi:hypothetical protein